MNGSVHCNVHCVVPQPQSSSMNVKSRQIESFDHILKDFVIQNNHRFQGIPSTMPSVPSLVHRGSGSGASHRTNSPKSPITPISVSPSLHRGGGGGGGGGSGQLHRHQLQFQNGETANRRHGNEGVFGPSFYGKQLDKMGNGISGNATWSSMEGRHDINNMRRQGMLSKMSESLDRSRNDTMKMFKEFDACYSSFTMSQGWRPQCGAAE